MGLIGLISCSGELPQIADSERPIAFVTYTSQPMATRADSSLMAVSEIPYGKSIGVYAYYHDNSTWATDPTQTADFMFNQQAMNTGLDVPFTYAPLKYWPNEEADKLSFIAYYPYSDGTMGITPNLTQEGTGLPTFNFAVKDKVKQQVDFMVSDLITDLPKSRDTGSNGSFNDLTVTDRVRFLFKHATAKIEFRVRVDEAARKDLAYFTLKGITLTNIYNEGRLTPTYSAVDGTALTWSDYGESHKTDYACKTTEAYLLLPQPLREDAHLVVDYDLAFKSEGTTYTYDASGNPVATEEYTYLNRSTSRALKELKVSGSEDCLTAWLPNHHYVYIIVIKPHAIDFTGQVVEWGDTAPESEFELEEP